MHGNVVEFPRHLYPPEGAKGIDIRRVCTVTAGTTDDLIMRFVCPQGTVAHFTHYSVYNDGLILEDFEFVPLVNGSRVFPYHGTPIDIPGTNGRQQKFLISLGLGSNLSNANLVNGEIILQPLQKIEWRVKNLGVVDAIMGVRMVGYFDPAQGVLSSRFGG
jgi:hypothetical protein